MHHDAAHRLARLHAALPTPYDADDKVSVRCLQRLVAHVKSQGIDGFHVGGSTGEGLLQSTGERESILAEAAQAAQGSALIGHVGAIATREAQTLARRCAALGYDAVSAIPSIYFAHRKDAVIGYYQDIVEAARSTPLIVYNIPAMSGVTLLVPECAAAQRLRRGAAGRPGIGSGGIGSTYNVMGRRWLELERRVRAGDLPAAAAMQSRCNAAIDELVKVGVFPGLKYLLHRQGVIETPCCRKPLATLTPATSGRLDDVARTLSE
jgi:N-acetylneuraminate lyase